MASVKPFPPGPYPAIVVGSGPGGLQISYFLRRLGVEHALISSDERPGGMFQRFPLYQRLISWTKPFAEEVKGTRAYERHDWNSLLAEEPEIRALVAGFMDGNYYFPSRQEMEDGLAAFVDKTSLSIRYKCRWEATQRERDEFVLETTDGEYRARVLVVAVGATEPWKPRVPGMEAVPHYAEVGAPEEYADNRVVIIGKRNSAFEVADALLPWARRLILVSPRPAQTALSSFSVGSIRARYLQPYEDYVLAGGNFVMDGAIERVEQKQDGFAVMVQRTDISERVVLDADVVIAATGFKAPLVDLPRIGVATFNQGRLPAQTPFWESPTVPGIYFAGSITQGAAGLRKYGIPSSSGAVHGFRHNARILATHIAHKHFGIQPARRKLAAEGVVPLLVNEACKAPELWNQKSYLCRVVSLDPDEGPIDEGPAPLAHFVDAEGADAVAITIETNAQGDTHPAVYVRRAGAMTEHLLPSNPLLDFATEKHVSQLTMILADLIRK